ncbi:MAG: sensor domain-containing diguanylate cyclase [Deltaproteobacteria bacterium]|nr:sensor domain-containing diguanylate cyclase [Deltaproteobacteria bacterium]
MPGFLKLFRLIKRIFLAVYIFVTSAVFIYLTAIDYFAAHRGDVFFGLALLILIVLFLSVFFRRIIPVLYPSLRPPSTKNDYEFVLVLINVLYFLITVAGQPVFNLEPLLYLFVTFALFFMPDRVGIFAVLVIFLQETLIYFLSSRYSLTVFLGHTIFLMMFGLLYYLLSYLERVRNRAILKSRINREVYEYREKIKDYRLIGSQNVEEIDRDAFLQATVLSIEESFKLEFSIIKNLLGLNTLALFLYDESKRRLKPVYFLSEYSDNISGEKIEKDSGLFSAVINSKDPIVVNSEDKTIRGQVYYKKAMKIKSFIGANVAEKIRDIVLPRGIIIADRLEQTFSDEHKRIFAMLADFIGSYVQTQRLLHNITIEREQKAKFFEASKRFNDALTLEQVMEASVESARVISASISDIIITLTAEENSLGQKFVFIHSENENIRKYAGKTVKDNSPVIKLVAEHRIKFPTKDFKGDITSIYGEQYRIEGISSIKVLPLITRGDALIGTFAVCTRNGSLLNDEETYMLETMSNILAISIENGIVVKKINDLATTDGLTGLFNHRVFQEKLDEVIARANRSQNRFSLALTDIDFFKKINDTYGHPVGDKVLKGLSALLKKMARETDIVARYGGEEFAIIMEDTDEQGAFTFGERIRREVEKLAFDGGEKTFGITISMGIATFFLDTQQKKELIGCADQALYYSKKNGRNQVWNYHRIKEKST